MKKAKKITIAIGATALSGTFIFLGTVTGLSCDYFKKGVVKGQPLYDQSQVEEEKKTSYEEGYNKHNGELALEIAKINADLEILKVQIASERTQKENYLSQLETVREEKRSVEEEKRRVEASNTQLQKDKLALQNEIASDKAEIERLKDSGEADALEIARLESVVSQKETMLENMQTTNTANLNTIIDLNNKIVSFSNQIVNLTNLVQNSANIVNDLNTKINKLERTIAYYETFISQFENENQATASFEFDGALCNIQYVIKGGKPTFPRPESTRYVTFNYWMLNGERVDESTCTISTSTKFVANVTYHYDVTYTVDGAQYGDIQLVDKGAHPTAPTNAPTKEGYAFEGWYLNGVKVEDPTQVEVNSNITFVARFAKLHTVSIVVEGNTTTQQVKDGEYAVVSTIESTPHRVFNGYRLNGELVNVATYPIRGSVTLVADLTYSYDVKFMLDETNQYGETQLIVREGKPTIPANPNKEGYNFLGWTIDGTNIVNTSTLTITQTTTLTAVFENILLKQFNSKNYVCGMQETIGKDVVFRSYFFEIREDGNWRWNYIQNGTEGTTIEFGEVGETRTIEIDYANKTIKLIMLREPPTSGPGAGSFEPYMFNRFTITFENEKLLKVKDNYLSKEYIYADLSDIAGVYTTEDGSLSYEIKDDGTYVRKVPAPNEKGVLICNWNLSIHKMGNLSVMFENDTMKATEGDKMFELKKVS